MAISLSDFSPHCLPCLQTHPKPSHFLCYPSKSSSYYTESKNSNLSLKPSFSKTPSHYRRPSEDKIRLANLLRKSLHEHNYTESLSVVESMASQGNLHTKSCAELIGRLSIYGQMDLAARVISLIESHRQAGTVLYNVFMTGLCRKKLVIPALETLGRMRANGCQPNTVTCNILVGGLCRQGMLDLAFETVEYLKRYYGVPPDLITYKQLLEDTIVKKGVKEGMKLFDEMESQGIRPDQTAFSIAVRAMCKAGHVDGLVAVLDAISASGVKLDFGDYRVMLEALLENKRFGEVDKVIDEILVRACCMRFYQPDSIVKKLCEEGLVDKARALAEGIVKGRWMNPGYKCCNMVIDAFIKEGHLNKAIDFINYLITIGRVPSISFYNQILSELCKCGHVRYASEMLDRLEKVGCSPDVVTYTMLIQALWNNGDHVGSVKMVSRLFEKGLSPDAVTYGTLILCLCHDDMVDEAMEVKRMMAENGFRVTKEIYNMLLLGFCKAGRVNEAIDLLEEMFESGCEVNEKSIVIVLEGLACNGHESEASKIAAELVLRNFLSPHSVDMLDRNFYDE